MSESWVSALNAYSYPVDLSTYERGCDFPGFFQLCVPGDRESTMAFEDRYRDMAPSHVAAFFEVVYWKLYWRLGMAQCRTSDVVDHVIGFGITSVDLWEAVQGFVREQTTMNLKRMRNLLGFVTDVLAVPLTLPALVSPGTIPMIDTQVAKWVNRCGAKHNAGRLNALQPFRMNCTSLRQNDFASYQRWVAWCREVAQVLTDHTQLTWRARDVEMAVFTAQRDGRVLSVLP